MISIIVGLVVAVLGLIGMVVWVWDLMIVLKGALPVCFFFSGILAIIAGVSSFKGSEVAKEKKADNSADE